MKTMAQAIETLEEAKRWAREHPGETYEDPFKADVLEAFDVLVAGAPSEIAFSRTMNEVLFLPEMLYRLTLAR